MDFEALKKFWEDQSERRELRYTPNDRAPYLLYYPAGGDCARNVGYYHSLEAVAKSIGYEPK